MKVTLTTHAKERIQQRVKLNTFSNVIDISRAIKVSKYTHNQTGNTIVNAVTAMNNKLVLLVVDVDNGVAVTAMTDGDFFDREINKAKLMMKKAA